MLSSKSLLAVGGQRKLLLLLLSTPNKGADLLTKETKRSTVSNCKANGVGDRCRRRKCYATDLICQETKNTGVSYLLQLLGGQ